MITTAQLLNLSSSSPLVVSRCITAPPTPKTSQWTQKEATQLTRGAGIELAQNIYLEYVKSWVQLPTHPTPSHPQKGEEREGGREKKEEISRRIQKLSLKEAYIETMQALGFFHRGKLYIFQNKQFSLQKKDRMVGMSHFVDILGTGQLEDRNQISFLERTDKNVTPEKIRAGDILNVSSGSAAQTHPNLCLMTMPSLVLEKWWR